MARSATINGIVLIISALLVGCLGLPSESSVARKYEAEHHGVKVISVTKTNKSLGPVVDARVDFHIRYQTSDRRIMQDTWTYGRVAEGWIRAGKN